MLPTIQILDYGSGNLFSIKNSLSLASSKVRVRISSKYAKGSAGGLVLPGVGSFQSAQKILSSNSEAILEDIQDRKMPVLGVCLGMQLMFEKSEEGDGTGLSLFKGGVIRLHKEPNLKIPHMGWNRLELEDPRTEFTSSLSPGEWAYFVHSFYPKPRDTKYVKAWTQYGKQRFPSIIQKENIFGTQFHPEKSSKTGFRLLSSFVETVILNSGDSKK